MSYWLTCSPLRHPKMRHAVTLLLELGWACAPFQERALWEQLRDVLDNRDVQGFILAWLARAGVVPLPPDPLALDSYAVHRERIVPCALDLKRATCATKSGIAKSGRWVGRKRRSSQRLRSVIL